MPVITPITLKPAEKQKVFCPVLMKESDCELAAGKFCDKNLSERMECSKLFEAPNIYNLIPHDSFLYNFIEHCNKITDAPDIFALGAGLTTIATILQRNVFMKWTGGKLYPNMYILLIMKSGGRKSTVLKVAKSLLEKLDVGDTSLVFPSDITPEAFYAIAQNRPNGVFFHSEFGGWLKSLDRNYNKGFKEFLTDIFDGFSQKKLIKGPNGTGQLFRIEEPAINILTASTIAWISENIKDSDRNSGFMQRFNIFYAQQDKKEIALPTAFIPVESLVADLKEISNIEGEIELSEEARQIYEEFYYSEDESKKRQSETYGSFQTRLFTLIIKIAIIYCVMRRDNIIEKEDIKYAIQLKLILEKHLYSVYDKLIKDRNQETLNKILNIVIDNGGVIERSKLLRYTHMLKKDFNNFIETLIERRSLAFHTEKTKTKSVVYYKIIGD